VRTPEFQTLLTSTAARAEKNDPDNKTKAIRKRSESFIKISE